MEHGELLFAAIKHTRDTESFSLPDQNYQRVKDLLIRVKPAFVTAEVKLHNEPAISVMGKSLFFASRDQLEQRDKDELEEPSYASEYVAAVIYARMHEVPLYFVDLYDSLAEDVALVNITELAKTNPEEIWNDSREFPTGQMEQLWEFEERNKFMAEVIKELLKKYPGQTGVHIGGADHFNSQKSKSIQDLVGNPNIRVVDLRD